MKKKNAARPLMGVMLEKVAPKIGAKVVMEPEWNIVGQILFKKGKKSYFRYSSLDINPLGSALLAKDKAYANFFMKGMGYSTVKGKTFYSDEWAKAIQSDQTSDKAYVYAQKLGFPVIVKPNDGFQGAGVVLAYGKQQFYRALKEIFKNTSVALVQEYVKGHDYRIVVLDREVVAAYERIPLSVTGNGRSTIAQLLQKKQKEFTGSSRDIHLHADDPRIKEKLSHQKMGFTSIPKKNEKIFLLDNANLSSGGEAVDVTDILHPAFKKSAITLTKDVGLRLCGVDLIIEGDIATKSQKYWILEVNAAPGLDHYARLGKRQLKTVEDLYLKVLKKILVAK